MPKQTLLRAQPRRIAGADSHKFNNHFFVLGAVEMMHSGWMLHEASRFKRYRFIRREFVSLARVPCTFDDGGVASLSVEVGFAHHPGWKLDLNNVETGHLRIAFNDSGLETEPVRLIDPLELLRCDTNDALRGFLS